MSHACRRSAPLASLVLGLLLSGCLGEEEKQRRELERRVEVLRETRACEKCDLRGVQLAGASLERTSFVRAHLEGVDFTGVKYPGNAHCSGAHLRGARLTGMSFTDGGYKPTTQPTGMLEEQG